MNLGLQGLFYSSFLVINVIFKFGFGGLVLYFYVIKKKMWAFCEFNMGFDDRMECRWMRTLAHKL